MRAAIETLQWLLDQAFEGGMSLLGNLEGVRPDDWWAVPPTGGRSIADILEHVGWAKWMYENYGFGDGSLKGGEPPMWPADGRARPRAEMVAWLKEGHGLLRSALDSLADDSELDADRFVYGQQARRPTRELFRIMIAHDFYHAGEINHIRALLQGTDRWPY